MNKIDIKLPPESYALAYVFWGIARHFNCTVCVFIAIALIVYTIIKMSVLAAAAKKTYKNDESAENRTTLRKITLFLVLDILFFALIIISHWWPNEFDQL